jgi:hypothetical protein
MKEYIKQFYNEGLATTFYTKPVNYLNKKIKNKKVVKFLSGVIKVLYTLLALVFAGYVLYRKLK